MKTEQLKATLATLGYRARDIKNNCAHGEHAANDLTAANEERRAYAEKALPVTLAAIIRDAETIAEKLPALRAYVAGAPAVPAGPEIQDGGFSLQTRFLSPTNRRGARVKVWRVDRLNGKTESLTVSFDHGARCPHAAAALAWFAKFGGALRCPPFKLVRGACDRGHVFTVLFSDSAAAPAPVSFVSWFSECGSFGTGQVVICPPNLLTESDFREIEEESDNGRLSKALELIRARS